MKRCKILLRNYKMLGTCICSSSHNVFSVAFFPEAMKLRIVWLKVNSSLNDKILALTKLKAFADDKIIVTQRLKFILGRVENIVGKEENAGYQHFFHLPQCFE